MKLKALIYTIIFVLSLITFSLNITNLLLGYPIENFVIAVIITFIISYIIMYITMLK